MSTTKREEPSTKQQLPAYAGMIRKTTFITTNGKRGVEAAIIATEQAGKTKMALCALMDGELMLAAMLEPPQRVPWTILGGENPNGPRGIEASRLANIANVFRETCHAENAEEEILASIGLQRLRDGELARKPDPADELIEAVAKRLYSFKHGQPFPPHSIIEVAKAGGNPAASDCVKEAAQIITMTTQHLLPPETLQQEMAAGLDELGKSHQLHLSISHRSEQDA